MRRGSRPPSSRPAGGHAAGSHAAGGHAVGGLVALLLGVTVGGCGGSAIAPAGATTGASATPGPSAAPASTPSLLPVAEIVTADASIAGKLGSYDLDGGGSDSPWLAFDALPEVVVSATDRLILRFVDGAAIGDHRIVVATADDLSGTSPQGVPDPGLDADRTSLAVGPLPAGRWVLQARLFRADGRGDGVTYWALTVR